MNDLHDPHAGAAQAAAAALSASPPAQMAERLRGAVRLLSENQLSLADFFRLLHQLAVATGEETFRLSQRPMVAGTAEFVFSSAANCATVGEALHAIARAYNILHGDQYNRVEQTPTSISYVIDDERFPYTVPRDDLIHTSLECSLIVLHCAMSYISGADLSPSVKWVSTRRPPQPLSGNQCLAFWDRPVRYQSGGYGLTYQAGAAARPLIQNAGLARHRLAIHNWTVDLIEARQSSTPPALLRDAVLQAMREGLQFQDEVAARLRLSVATLRRRLEDEGESFRDLRKALLNERAKKQLLESESVIQVSERLGFADACSFSRAFKAWNGVTPAAWIRAETGSPTETD